METYCDVGYLLINCRDTIGKKENLYTTVFNMNAKCNDSIELPMPSKNRRSSSFASTSSPWFRRNSSLSPAMIQSENFSVYESSSYSYGGSRYNIISLKESQGFVFNQDLFASPFQQLRALVEEKRIRTKSGSFSNTKGRIGSHNASNILPGYNSHSKVKIEMSFEGQRPYNGRLRRHTSHDISRPFSIRNICSDDNAILDDENDDCDDTHDLSANDEDDSISRAIPGASHVSRRAHDQDVFMEEEEAEEEDYNIGEDEEVEEADEDDDEEEEGDDDDDDYRVDTNEDMDTGENARTSVYRVKVTDILVNEDDESIFPL